MKDKENEVFATIKISEERGIVEFECFIDDKLKSEKIYWLSLYNDSREEIDHWDNGAYILDLYNWLSGKKPVAFKKKQLKRELKEFCVEHSLVYNLYKETILNVLKRANKLRLLKIKL